MRRPIFTGTDGKRAEGRERKKFVRKRLSVKSMLAGDGFCLVTAGRATNQSDCFIGANEVDLVSFSAMRLVLSLCLWERGDFFHAQTHVLICIQQLCRKPTKHGRSEIKSQP